MESLPIQPSGRLHHHVVGDDFKVNLDLLQGYCVRELSDAAFDFLVIAASVSQIDRWCHRQRSSGWARELSLTVPVFEPDRWSDPAVSNSLAECLHYLTGDEWDFEFCARSNPESRTAPHFLEFSTPPSDDRVVMPYSGGLDSYAQLQLFKAESKVDPLLVTTWAPAQSGVVPVGLGHVSGTRLLAVNVKRRDGVHAEPTFRSRTFLFNAIAAIAAHLSDIEVVVVPENGQGSLGASVLPVGDEWPARGTTPMFTSRMQALLRSAADINVRFQHPRLWDTKGEVLLRLMERGVIEGWERTTSCPRNIRRSKSGTASRHCGVCGGCLLRRLAVHRSGVRSNSCDYFWRDLSARSLAASAPEQTKSACSDNDWDIAVHNVRFMEELALLAGRDQPTPAARQLAFEVAAALGVEVSESTASLERLVSAHAAEWAAFVGDLASSSWVRAVCGR